MSSDVSKTESIEYWISIFETWYSEHYYILTKSHLKKNLGPTFLCKSLHSDKKPSILHAAV